MEETILFELRKWIEKEIKAAKEKALFCSNNQLGTNYWDGKRAGYTETLIQLETIFLNKSHGA